MGWIEGVSALKTGQTHLSEVLRCLWELCRVPKPRLSPSGARTVGRRKPQAVLTGAQRAGARCSAMAAIPTAATPGAVRASAHFPQPYLPY